MHTPPHMHTHTHTCTRTHTWKRTHTWDICHKQLWWLNLLVWIAWSLWVSLITTHTWFGSRYWVQVVSYGTLSIQRRTDVTNNYNVVWIGITCTLIARLSFQVKFSPYSCFKLKWWHHRAQEMCVLVEIAFHHTYWMYMYTNISDYMPRHQWWSWLYSTVNYKF